jgi:hypothetical protein
VERDGDAHFVVFKGQFHEILNFFFTLTAVRIELRTRGDIRIRK